MKYSTLYLLTSITLLSSGCGKNDTTSLDGKKAKLAELQEQQQTISADIKKLQKEIAHLDPQKSEEKVKNVVATPLASQTFKHFVEATGAVDAVNNVYAVPQTGGAITAVYVKEGDYVGKGQKIASIDNSIMKTSIQEVYVQLETAKTIFERTKALWEQKIGTEVQYIQAKTQVEALEKRIATLKAQDAYHIVVAPISGYIDEVRQKAGEMAMPGMGIVRIINLNSLKVVANIPDTYAGTIKQGDRVNIKFPDLHREMESRLSFVSQTVNPVNRTFVVEATIPNGDKQLKPNLMAIVNINDQSNNNALVIDQNIIQHNENGDVVYVAVIEGNKKIARSRLVKTGLVYNGKVEIKSGLTGGDVLITEGYQELVDGQLINY